MVILMAAAIFFGAFLGRFFTAASLFPVCFLIAVVTLAETQLSVPESALRIFALIVSLELGYVIGLASTDISTICQIWRGIPRDHARRHMCILSRLRSRCRTITSRDGPSGRDESKATPAEAGPGPYSRPIRGD